MIILAVHSVGHSVKCFFCSFQRQRLIEEQKAEETLQARIKAEEERQRRLESGELEEGMEEEEEKEIPHG